MKRKSEILLEMVEEIFSTDEESFKELTYSPWLKLGGSLVGWKPGTPPCSTAFCRFEAGQCSPRKNYAPLRRQAGLNRGTSLYD